jgi:hypothetical protein
LRGFLSNHYAGDIGDENKIGASGGRSQGGPGAVGVHIVALAVGIAGNG